MSYQVVAALVLAKNEQGLIQYVYEGGIIPWLSAEQAEHFLADGLVIEIAAVPSEPAADLPGGGDLPLASATKPVLTKWVVDNRVKDDGSKYTAAELKSVSKDDLWALINGPEEVDEKPPADADTDVLVDWLDEHGEYDRAELEAQTDDQLWELIEATEV